MTDFTTLSVKRSEGIALLSFNRPDRLNAIDTAMRREFVLAAQELNADESVRVVVLTGSGRAFSAGADLAEDGGVMDGQLTEDMLNQEFKPGLLAIAEGPKPWISAVNGPCAGIGTAYAMACDLMVMAEDAYLYQAFAAIGLVPDGGATWQLARALGRKRAYELIVTGEKLPAARCAELGLCNRVVAPADLLDQAMAWAAELAGKAPLAIRYAKESLNFAMEHGLGEVISNEARLQHICVDSEDAREGGLAFLQKRKPAFTGR